MALPGPNAADGRCAAAADPGLTRFMPRGRPRPMDDYYEAHGVASPGPNAAAGRLARCCASSQRAPRLIRSSSAGFAPVSVSVPVQILFVLESGSPLDER